jgi:hypothetical protein
MTIKNRTRQLEQAGEHHGPLIGGGAASECGCSMTGSARPASQRRLMRPRGFAPATNAIALPLGCFFHLGRFVDLLLLRSNERLILLFDRI